MKLSEIYRVVNAELALVDSEIKETIPRKQDAFRDACLQILNNNSKRIRPALVLIASKLLNYKKTAAIKLATAVELFHTATLVHDDIIDASTLRRGAKTINAKFGINSAILVADYLYLHGALHLNGILDGNSHLNKQLTKLVLSTAHKMFSGELDQLMSHTISISRKEYFNIITQKTASFFSACCGVPAILSNATSIQKGALLLFGKNLGIAFQITDDILDIVGDEKKFGKRQGLDMDGGFFTLPLVHFYEKATQEERSSLLEILTKKKKNLKRIIALLERYNSIEYAKSIAQNYARKAKKNVSIFPGSKAKSAFLQLCDFVVAREQ
jgi:geranylgeranyl pyrophosphate synthase